ncbi:hypothetical protein CR513_09435, partial [Mucuna pruriens]
MAEGPRGKYGKILGLLQIDVQSDALAILVQFYDAPLKCFTFKDFQLTPTLEEYKCILRMPIEGSSVYFHKGISPILGNCSQVEQMQYAE